MNSTRFHDVFADRVAKLSTDYEKKVKELEYSATVVEAYENTCYAPQKGNCCGRDCLNMVIYVNVNDVEYYKKNITYLLTETKDGHFHSKGLISSCYHAYMFPHCTTTLLYCSDECASYYKVFPVDSNNANFSCEDHVEMCCCGNVARKHSQVCQKACHPNWRVCDECVLLCNEGEIICRDCANTL
jgi:hypothetical protein